MKWAVFTIEEARELKTFIEKVTATKAYPVNFEKMKKLGIYDAYINLDKFICASVDHSALMVSLS